ncbi:MAG: ATP-binding protein [Bdellovibrio sp.]|nr:ATP-binding protein [Bdellovibrio sp.]
MLLNPFTPSEIAGLPADFFGRTQELRLLERSLTQGSVAIQGAMGIGKSSLLARIRLLMEGFDSTHSSQSVVAVGDRDILTVDDAARLVLESFSEIDEKQNKILFKLGSILEIESIEICSYFKAGRHLAALKRIVEQEYIKMILVDREFLLLAIDEADKCPIPIARLVRSITTHSQQNGVKNVRFILAGVSPFFQEMLKEDAGVNRFFYKTVTLLPMSTTEATELVEAKLVQVVRHAEGNRIRLHIQPKIITRIVNLSGGHPHLLQLLGAHIVENEDDNPDGIIDAKDLLNSLSKICYEDRARVYNSTIHMLELHNKMDALKSLLDMASPKFPTRISRRKAKEVVTEKSLEWLIEQNILSVVTEKEYGLLDEFLRIRMVMDEATHEAEAMRLEKRLIRFGSLEERIEKRGRKFDIGTDDLV